MHNSSNNRNIESSPSYRKNFNSSNLNLAYEQMSIKNLPKMNNTNNRTNSRSGYLDYNDHYLNVYSDNSSDNLNHQYQYGYLNNDNYDDNLGVDRLDYVHSNDHVYGHHMSNLHHKISTLRQQGRQMQDDDCKSIHQYEEPMNLIRPMPSAFNNLKSINSSLNNSNNILNSLNRNKNFNKQLLHQENIHALEMASRKEINSENSDESVMSMESNISEKRLMKKNETGSSSCSNGPNSMYHGRSNFDNSSRKYIRENKDHSSDLPNSSDCSLSKSNVDTVSSNVPGSSTATLEADARFMNLISSNGNKYSKNSSNLNCDNERIYGLSTNKLNNPLENLSYGNMAEENIYNNGSAASTSSVSNIHLKTSNTLSSKINSVNNHNTSLNGNNLMSANLLNEIRNKSATLQSTNQKNFNQYNTTLYSKNQNTTGPLIPSNNPANSLLTSQLLENSTGTTYHTSLHHASNPYNQNNQGFKMLNSRFSFSLVKSCNSNQPCYWRLASLLLILLCLVIIALFAYKQASNTALIFNEDSAKPCVLVDDYPNGQLSVFPPPQFLPKQQNQLNSNSFPFPSASPKAHLASSSSSVLLPISSSINLAVPSASTFHNSLNVNSNNTNNLFHIPTDPLMYKKILFDSINSDYQNINSQTAKIVEKIGLNGVIAGKFNQQTGGLIKFHLKQLPIWTRLAFFAKRTVPPTLTNHELMEFITADGPIDTSSYNSKRRISRSIFEKIIFENKNFDSLENMVLKRSDKNYEKLRSKRSSLNNNGLSSINSGSTVSIDYLEYFEPGNWYFVLINDAAHDQQFTLHLNISKLTSAKLSCEKDCNSHGSCQQGKCICDSGFTGTDCSQSVCPILCSGNGQYIRGTCKCNSGWFGNECESRRLLTCAQQDIPCNGHGLCVAANCVCNSGFSGQDCEQQDINTIENCSKKESDDIRLDYENKLIQKTTEKQKDLETCLALCSNGSCDENGICICHIGYTGRFCSLTACANNCSFHGQCIPLANDYLFSNIKTNQEEDKNNQYSQKNEYQCVCSADWTGPDCSFKFERNCADDIDNDNDGLIDCADSECCAKDECKDSLMCLTSPDPLDIVLRKPSPSITASFYQKTKFLIEEGSVQSYAHRDEYSESRVSVIRGQIVTPDGNGLTSIRISVATDPQFGFTLTRPDGWFDILVNGGAMVTLQFQRSPFHPIKHSIYVAWNEIVVMQSPIVMSVVVNTDDNIPNNLNGSGNQLTHSSIYNNLMSKSLNNNNSNNYLLHQQQYTLETIFWPYVSKHHDSRINEKYLSSLPTGKNNLYRTTIVNSTLSIHCWSHDYKKIQPIIINRFTELSEQGNLLDQSLIILEDRSLSESYKIPDSNLQLVYQSSSSSAYLSVIELQLTPEKIPHNLALIHLRIVVEGILFTKELEAKPLLRYSYGWNKRNVYKQKVYGLANAKIYIGYEYENCQHIIWSTLSTKLNGFQMDISEFSNWNLQIHHRLNLNEKIVQMGSGGTISLKHDVFLKETFGKKGEMRQGNACLDTSKSTENCSSNLLKQPVSITSGSDGSLYVGDNNVVRRIKPDGSSTVVFILAEKKITSQFKTVVNSNKKQNYLYNYYLQYSAFDGHLYISDSEHHQIMRSISLENVEQPETNFEIVAGNGLRCLFSEGSDSCGDGGLAIDARLSYPKSIVFSTDNSIYFSDGTSVRRINRKGFIFTIIGANSNIHKLKPLNCDHLHNNLNQFNYFNQFKEDFFSNPKISARKIKLNWPTHLAINPLNNLLYILDEGHVIYELTADHRLRIVYGKPAHCSSSNDYGLITSFVFTSIGEMYISIINAGVHQIKIRTTDGAIKHYLGDQTVIKPNIDIFQSDYENQNYFDTKADFKLTTLDNVQNHFLSSYLDNCLISFNPDDCQAFFNYENLIDQNKTKSTSRFGNLNKPLSIKEITTTGDNLLHILDDQNLQVLSVKKSLDEKSDKKKYYTLFNSLTEELYVFNKHGLHQMTLNAMTGKIIYTFNYDINTNLGKLISVLDSSNNKVAFVRQQGKLNMIISPNEQKIKITLNSKNQLESIQEENGLKKFYQYDSNYLLISKSDNLGNNFHYEYNEFGKIISIIKPSGVRLDLITEPNVDGSKIYLKTTELINSLNNKKEEYKNNVLLFYNLTNKQQTMFFKGTKVNFLGSTDSNYLITNSFNQTVHLTRDPNQEFISFLPNYNALQSCSIKQFVYTKTSLPELERLKVSWDIDIKLKKNKNENNQQLKEDYDEEIVAVERALNIDGIRFLSIEYDRTANREIMYNNSRRPFLMIQYDNSSRPIQWLNTETRLPLNVVYDQTGRLAGWQQGSMSSETFIYNNNGFLVEIKYPDSSSIKYIYKNDEKADTKIPNKEYTNNLQENYFEAGSFNSKPTKIILRSGKEFYYKYDTNAGLKEIWAPKSSVKHQFKISISLGYYKLVYGPPGFSLSNGYIIHFNDQLKPTIEQHCNAYSKILYKYNTFNGQLSEIVYGGGKVVRNFGSKLPSQNLLENEYWLEGNDKILISYTYKSTSLPTSSEIIYETKNRLYNFYFEYNFDKFLRKTSINCYLVNIFESKKNQNRNNLVNSIKYSYNEKTGKLEKFANFKIVDHHDYLRKQNESLISDGQATFSKIYDSVNHKLKQFSLTIRDKEVFRIIYNFNSNNMIMFTRRFMALKNNQHSIHSLQTNFTYDLDEQLVEMRSELDHWRFSYDDNFNLIRIQYRQNAIEISIDHAKDRISNFGDTPYIYDDRGFLIRRGEELFNYNNFGLLISVKKLTKQHEINYLYDAKGRLSARIDSLGNRTQYIYGDIKKSHLLTHMIQFNVEKQSAEIQSQAKPLITNFIYDDTNALIAFTINDKQLFYVVCDQSGSPTHVYESKTGDLIKVINRSPFGHILYDSNPSIHLPIGFHGAINEPLISIIFFQGRYVYDTLVGQFLQPNYGQILNAGVIEPKYLSLYRYARNDPLNLDLYSLSRADRYDINKWMQHQGIDLSGFDLELSRYFDHENQHFSKILTNVEDVVYSYRRSGIQRKQIPSLGYGSSEKFDALSYGVNMIAKALPLPNIGIGSQLFTKLKMTSMNFGRISFAKKSQLKSDQLFEPSKIDRLHSEQIPFGNGICLSTKRSGNLFIKATLDADQTKFSIFSKVLKNSELINLQQTKKGKDLFYFVKPDTVSISEDLSELQKLGNNFNVTINEVKTERLSDIDSKSKVDIHLESISSSINIRYGSILIEERQRLLDMIKKNTINDKWKQIQQTLIDLKRSLEQFNSINHDSKIKIETNWSDRENEIIINTGILTTYTGEYYHDVKHYPELADDPSNIIFVKN